MTYEEYTKDLTDQIGNKRAKQLVMQEINNHIEELTASLEQSGLSHEEALNSAVEEMGNPVETGIDMNRIHRPRFPYVLYTLTVILTVFGVFLQSKIIPFLDNARMNHLGLSQAITYGIVGLILAFLIIFFDYTLIVKHAYKLWIVYLFLMVAAPFITGVPLLHNAVSLISMLAALFPILFAALLYRQRNREWKGILWCMGILMVTAAVIMVFGYFYTIGFLAETIMICILMMVVTTLKGIMGKQKKVMLAITVFIPLVMIGAFVGCYVPLATYQIARIDVFLHPGKYVDDMQYNYIGVILKRIGNQFTTIGSHTLEQQTEMLPSMQMHTDYAVTSMFTWFGIVIGSMVLVLLFSFFIYSLYMTAKQNNRISFLFGTMCSMTMLIRCVFYVLNNFGLFIPYSTYFPFLKYGLANAVVNGCYIGIILCVYRNSNILGEQVDPAKVKIAQNRRVS